MMKQTVARNLALLFAGLLLTACLFVISEMLAPTYPLAKARMKILASKAPAIEAINVGNSHARALDFNVLGMEGFQLWRNGGDLFETCYLLNAVTPLLPNLHIVFMNISPGAFHYENGVDPLRFPIRRELYAVTPTSRSWQTINGDYKNLVYGKLSPIMRADHWRGVLRVIAMAIVRPGEWSKIRNNAAQHVQQDGKMGPDIYTVFEYKNDQRIQEKIKMLKQADWGSAETPAQAKKVLIATIQMLHSRNIRPVFYMTPFTESAKDFARKHAPSGLLLTRTYMEEIKRQYGVEYYDFMDDEKYSRRPEYFFNESHLNKFGAEEFTRDLMKKCGLRRKQRT